MSFAALGAVALLGAIGWRVTAVLTPHDGRSTRAALALVIGAALLCSGYGILGQLCTRSTADVELVFHGDPAAAPRSSTSEGAGEVRVLDDRVTHARATPRGLLVFAIVCAGAAIALRTRRARPRHSRRPALAHLLWLPIGLAAIAALRGTARGYDALWYHLPTAAAFAQNGHLEPPGRDLVFYFPSNLELLARTMFDLFGTRAMPLVQLPFALALPPLAFALARRLGAGRASWFAAALALASPMVVFQSGLAYADLLSCAALAAGAILLLDALSAEGARALGLAAAGGAALGLGLGAKYAAVPLIGCGLPIFSLCALRGRGAVRARFARAFALSAIVLVGLAAPSWFWYLRNLRLSGNPIFPIAVPWLHLRGLFLGDAFNRGKELELVRSQAEWLVYPWLENLSHESGFGAAFVALVPPALPILVVLCLRRWRGGPLPRLFLPIAWGLAYTTAWWVGTPHEVRHLLPLVVLFGAPACVLLRGAAPSAHGLRVVTAAGLAIGTVVTLRLQLFSPLPELSLRPADPSSFYGFPEQVLAALPPGARVANLAGRPYNFMLLGPALTLRPFDYAPDAPSDAALADRGATHVFVRAPAGTAARPGWRLVHQGAPTNATSGATSGATWSFWGASPTDITTLYELPVSRTKIGDGPKPQ